MWVEKERGAMIEPRGTPILRHWNEEEESAKYMEKELPGMKEES